MLSNFSSIPVVEIKKGLFIRKAGGTMHIVYRRPACIHKTMDVAHIMVLMMTGLLLFSYEFNEIAISNYSGKSVFYYMDCAALLILGFLMVYRALAMIIDHSEIHVNPRGITIHHSPLPFPGAKDITVQLSEIKNIGWHPVYNQEKTMYSTAHPVEQPCCVVITDQENLTHIVIPDITDSLYAEVLVKELSGFLHY